MPLRNFPSNFFPEDLVDFRQYFPCCSAWWPADACGLPWPGYPARGRPLGEAGHGCGFACGSAHTSAAGGPRPPSVMWSCWTAAPKRDLGRDLGIQPLPYFFGVALSALCVVQGPVPCFPIRFRVNWRTQIFSRPRAGTPTLAASQLKTFLCQHPPVEPERASTLYDGPLSFQTAHSHAHSPLRILVKPLKNRKYFDGVGHVSCQNLKMMHVIKRCDKNSG